MSAIKKVDRSIDRFLERNGLDLTDDQKSDLQHMIESLVNSRDRQIKKLRTGKLAEESMRLKDISGGLRQTIHTYGPITKERIGSAAKRIHATMVTHIRNTERDA